MAVKQEAALRRNVNLDLIRCAAVLSVLGVHFFLNTDFYHWDIQGRTMVVLLFFRCFCTICVPLFALLSGYLNMEKQLSKQYFWKIVPLLVTYLLCAGLTLLFRVSYLGEQISPWQALVLILSVSDGAISYAWYVEMYIGLFLLTPFLNRMYAALETRENRRLLLGVLFFVTVLPQTNGFGGVLPDWWKGIWPITYYFLGAYFRDYGCSLPVKGIALALFVFLSLFTGVTAWQHWGSRLYEPTGVTWGDFPRTVTAVLTFLLLLRLDLSRVPQWIRGLLTRISRISLGIYLCSWISDQLVYPVFNAMELHISRFLLLAPVVVVASFCLAAVLAQLVAWVQGLLLRR